MGEHGHEIGGDGYATWADVATTAPPEVVRRHLLEPPLLRAWVPGAEDVALVGDELRMTLVIGRGGGARGTHATYATRSRSDDERAVTRGWALVHVRRLVGEWDEETETLSVVRYTLTPDRTGTTVACRIETVAEDPTTRSARVVARAQAQALGHALDRLARAAEGRRQALDWRGTTVPVGPL